MNHTLSIPVSNKMFFKKTEYDVSLKKWATPGLFIFISSSFNYIWQKVNKCTIKIRRLLDSNRRPLMSEATALITESQPLPKTEYVYRASLGHKIICLTWGGKGYWAIDRKLTLQINHWSAGSPSNPTIQVWIPPKSTYSFRVIEAYINHFNSRWKGTEVFYRDFSNDFIPYNLSVPI